MKGPLTFWKPCNQYGIRELNFVFCFKVYRIALAGKIFAVYG